MQDPPRELEIARTLPRDRSPGIGCIGAGFIMADCHLVAYREAGFHPVAIWSRTARRAEEVARRHSIPRVHGEWQALLDDPSVQVLDIAVPPDRQPEIILEAARQRRLRGILAQKPLALDYPTAARLVKACEDAGIVLAVNQNMRHDPSIRALKDLLGRGVLGEPVLATIDMRAIPHWMDWVQGYGKLTFYVMSIHHLDAFRFLFGDPERVLASARPDPRTRFPHTDGITMYILEHASGLRCLGLDDVWTGPAREGAAADISIRWRVEGTDGIAEGTIGWPDYPARSPSALRYSAKAYGPRWIEPQWDRVWFPDAFSGSMGDLLVALEQREEPETSGRDNLGTIALVEACYRGALEHRIVPLDEVRSGTREEKHNR
ncbi:MAG TPA: Gfo/Idh/MocA family oxidoreductase [Planctomycetota bacterium]|jgi:predicted dehydrogenase|nr:Gfo/Idh/MocA family oxidoreductase [Planctomycetota bacterium]